MGEWPRGEIRFPERSPADRVSWALVAWREQTRPAARGASVRALLCVLVSVLCESPLTAQQPSIDLVEQARWLAPEAFRLRGVSLAIGGEVLVWSPDEIILLNRGLDSMRAMALPEKLSANAAGLRADGLIEVLSIEPIAVHLLDWEGHLLSADTFASTHHLVHGVWSGSDWVVLVEGISAGALERRLLRLESGEDIRMTELASVDAVGMLAARDDRVLVAETSSPFRVRVWEGDRFVQAVEPPAPLLDSLGIKPGEGRSGNWVSLAALPLGSDILQTLADLTSDRRLILVFDEVGSLVGHRLLEAPLGFVASGSGEQVLIAVRRLNRVEVVRYEWRWRAP